MFWGGKGKAITGRDQRSRRIIRDSHNQTLLLKAVGVRRQQVMPLRAQAHLALRGVPRHPRAVRQFVGDEAVEGHIAHHRSHTVALEAHQHIGQRVQGLCVVVEVRMQCKNTIATK